ncbi:hypothetical protein P8C59_009483 [Phyllachora maydis]|uniref:Uncharacterized protein n=1 Tax=Phyllachora maydis TaxID=1825666 RepID=A0AAD9IF97_9PEZI|nr:hypothetical protein P8C59_009483 [Phyllachora maydis]
MSRLAMTWAEAIKSFLVRDVPARRRRQGWAVAHRFCDIGAFDADKWRCPPLKHAFSCQPVAPPEAGYWLALADGPADAALAGRVRSATYVGDNDGGVGTLCPYLLVDYLAGTDAKPSTSRLLYCAAFVLYNRYRLRERALGGGAAARAEDLGDVRHYALAFSRRRFQMWCLRPKTPTEAGSVSYPSKSGYTADADADADADAGPVEGSSRAGGDGPATGGGSGNAFPAADGNDNGIMGGIQAVPQHWCGCNASLLLDGACASEEDLGELARWLNGIHRWGLTRHAAAVEADCVKLT